MTDADMITLPETKAELAAEDAAFVKAFNETRAEDVAGTALAEPPVLEEEPVVPVETPAAVAPVETPAPVEGAVVPPGETPKLFAGLTEEQLQAALARSGTLQGTVDKMAGRIGQLMQQIEALRKTPPTTQQAQVALDLKLEKLGAAFPELASMLREDLAGLQTPATAAPLVPAPPAGITQEQLDAILAERLNATNETMREQIEMKVLSIQHPDWLKVIKTPQFALWRDNVLGAEEGAKLMASEDSVFISQHLNDFKAWRDKPAPAAEPLVAPVVPEPPKRTTRLANAVLPNGTAPVTTGGPITEEDAFAAGFAGEQKRAGRA